MRGSAHRRSQSTSALARSQPPSPPMANGRGPREDEETARNYFSGGAGALRRTSSRASNEAVDERAGDSSDGSLAGVKPPSKQRKFARGGSKSSLLPTHSGGGTSGADDFLGCQVRFRLPSNAQLCRIFFAMTAMIALINVASWGMGDMYGPHLPRTGRFAPSHDLHRLYERSTIASTHASLVRPRQSDEGVAVARDGTGAAPMPLMIPRIIHQTYKTSDVPDRVKGLMRTWAEKNPGWKTRFYNDAECYKFVEREFPEYYDAYVSLPKDVERSDFFRYLIVLHTGGVYADIDTECRQPMDSYLRSTDTLVVGWENEFRTDEMAYSRHFVRRRQVLNWVFAGAPGHPALREICDHIARSAHRVFTNNTNRDTLERTGPGAFTDVVVRQFWLHSKATEAAKDVLAPRATNAWGTEDIPEVQARLEEARRRVPGTRGQKGDAWNVRVMPKVSFGVHPTGEDGVPFDDPGVLVAHHFLGSWKSRKGWNSAKKGVGDYVTLFFTSLGLGKSGLEEYRAQLSRADPFYAMPKVNERAGYPVSAAFDPPFDMLTHLSGSNASGGNVDVVGASLTKWGGWQAGRHEPKAPTSAEALVGSLSSRGYRGGVLLDVGAGLGFFSLAAAARGFPVIAYEWNGGDELLKASVAHNGFGELVDVRVVRMGGRGEQYCRAIASAETAARRTLAGPRGRGARANARVERIRRGDAGMQRGAGEGSLSARDVDHELLGVSDAALERTRERLAEAAATRVDTTADAGVDGYARDDEGERDDGVRRRRSRSLLQSDPAKRRARGSRPLPSVRVPTPRVPVHLTRESILHGGDSPFPCEIAHEARISSVDDELGVGTKGVEPRVTVAAMRIGFGDGWERHVLEGARRLLTTAPPPVVLIELSPRLNPGPTDERLATHAALDWLWSLGYTDVAHSGEICEERWRNVTRHADTRGGGVGGADHALKQPTWCHASRADLPALAYGAGTEPESVLLHHESAADERLKKKGGERGGDADLLPADADVDR